MRWSQLAAGTLRIADFELQIWDVVFCPLTSDLRLLISDTRHLTPESLRFGAWDLEFLFIQYSNTPILQRVMDGRIALALPTDDHSQKKR